MGKSHQQSRAPVQKSKSILQSPKNRNKNYAISHLVETFRRNVFTK